jgi:Ion channel
MSTTPGDEAAPEPDEPRHTSRARRAGQGLRHLTWDVRAEPHDRFGLLLGLLVTVFVLSAFTGRAVHFITVLLNIVMLLVAFRATGLRRFRHLTTIAVIGLCGTAVARVLSDAQNTVIIASWSQAVVLAAILMATVARVLQHEKVHLQTLLGAFSAYFLIGLVFSWLYIGLNQIGTPFFGAPTSDAEFPYFSFITLTTVGYGDYVAVGRFNQRLVVIEALVGQIFLASLVARLVTLYGRRRPEQTPPGAGAVPGPAPGPDPDRGRAPEPGDGDSTGGRTGDT